MSEHLRGRTDKRSGDETDTGINYLLDAALRTQHKTLIFIPATSPPASDCIVLTGGLKYQQCRCLLEPDKKQNRQNTDTTARANAPKEGK